MKNNEKQIGEEIIQTSEEEQDILSINKSRVLHVILYF